jgi:hypothetical protein
MPIYSVYEVKNADAIFTSFTKKQDKIIHPSIKDFRIQKEIDHIRISGTDYVKSILSTETNEIIDQINFEMIIARHKIIYSIVGLSGRGIMTVHGYIKYIKDKIITPIQKYFKEKLNLDIRIERFKYDNENFSKDYWGENITTEMAYYSSEKLFIRISCSNFYNFIQKNPDLNKYFTEGTIKSIKGHLSDLDYKEKTSVIIGSYKFDRQGQFNLNFFDVSFFNNFVRKMIDKNFFNSGE